MSYLDAASGSCQKLWRMRTNVILGYFFFLLAFTHLQSVSKIGRKPKTGCSVVLTEPHCIVSIWTYILAVLGVQVFDMCFLATKALGSNSILASKIQLDLIANLKILFPLVFLLPVVTHQTFIALNRPVNSFIKSLWPFPSVHPSIHPSTLYSAVHLSLKLSWGLSVWSFHVPCMCGVSTFSNFFPQSQNNAWGQGS